MADTVINTPAARDYDSGANAMGWAIAVILLLGIILFGIFVWPGVGSNVVPSTNTSPGIDVNVRLPEGAAIPGTNSGNSGGGTQQTPTQPGGTQTQ